MRRGVDVTAIAEVLEKHGHDPALAVRWANAGRRAGLVDLYCRVGVWHPDAAEAAENLGLGVGELAHHQKRSWGDTVEQLDEALGWYGQRRSRGLRRPCRSRGRTSLPGGCTRPTRPRGRHHRQPAPAVAVGGRGQLAAP
ncbi:MAG: hypothetical protein ACRD0G_00415 [Acidimicrobiales bacterium]